MKRIHVRVPATTANLGPGYDCLGLALSLWNDAEFCCEGLGRAKPRRRTTVSVEIRGCGADDLPTDRSNLIWRAAARVMTECHLSARSVLIRAFNRIPLSSGLGSSAAACVAGLVAANALCGARLDRERLLRIAAEIEGHPDNAAPALWGGLTACYDAGGRTAVVPVSLRARLRAVVCTPDLRVATAKARAALPARISHRDATLAVGRAVAIAAKLANGDTDGLAAAMDDTLHQPYRAKLVPGMDAALAAAKRAGALGAALSGAGPTIVAFTSASDASSASRVAASIRRVFRKHGLDSTSRVLNVDRRGARLLKA